MRYLASRSVVGRRWLAWGSLWATGWITTQALAQPSILLADDARPAHVAVSWTTQDGKTISLEGDRGYKSAAQKTPLGHNVECYVALGGTRLNKGLGHPDGAGVLVGLYKLDAKKPFFADIAENATITMKLDHVFMNQPVVPRPQTVLMHLRYMMEDLQACGLSGNARNLFNTADPEDPIKDRTLGASARLGCLDGKGDDHGSVDAKTEADGSVTLTIKFPYPLLRHTEDPYKRTKPGGFFEPNHFHIEIELLPKAVADKLTDSKPPATPDTGKSVDKPIDAPAIQKPKPESPK